ncbi:pilus assembly protein TadG-related protein [Mesorhizobium sp. VK25A]|uniref:Pilus assembly protein TadG-related protein n=1 Tax=Mesorhizobium vachelliae TaxID=3072309 RepID=A0ABU5AEM4_9HYPH|nr:MULTISPECIES: pilus assembly protein TadG-related protein [unclassified Mesorhizobium]MDX8535715.1 pilus assembly protein TadG-related protein [Mesorhizobium sp. VK25D]MDX8548441.1 pilus assembly protein TadG-related protein [Mesorhizobium sp. VK25A]
MLGTIRKFWRDQRGVALLLVSIMLPAIIGFSLLAIDMSRVNNMHNDLQKGADGLALAAAAELDGRTDSIVRADRALSTLVFNKYTFSTANVPQTLLAAGVTRTYLRSLPASDSSPIAAANIITDEVTDAPNARFIRVTVTPVGFAAIFPASFLTGNAANNSFNVGAVSVAGFTSGVCNYTPVFICNPYEMVNGTNSAGGVTLEQAVADTSIRRRLIELRTVGNNAAYGPGNFGFLAPPSTVGNGAQGLAETIATSKPLGCYSSQGVSTKTGQNTGPIQDAFNVRFGIDASGNGFNSPEYGPAANVRKGASANGNGNQCPKYNQLTFNATGDMGLPHDATTPYMSGRMGDGNWDLSGYWSTNFGGTSYPSSWDTSKPTRYQVYKYEIANSLVGHASTGGEVGTPPSSCQPPVTSVDRRLLYGAILNCNALEAAGNDLNGNSTNLPVEAFASFFLTEPVAGANSGGSVFVELVDVTGRGGQGTLDSFLRDESQLYR